MTRRSAIYLFSILFFAPAGPLFYFGLLFIPALVISDLARGYIETAIWLLPLFGSIFGLAAALVVTFDIAGNSLLQRGKHFKRLGLLMGIASELYVISLFPPRLEPFLEFWLPPLIGGAVLFVLSFVFSANNTLKRDGPNRATP